MIIGIGTDIIEISRIENLIAESGQKFIDKIFNPAEQIDLSSSQAAAHYAKRFAGKEAIAKALGTGIGASISFKDIIITNDKNGAPKAEIKNQDSETKIHLSLSDEKSHAIAFVVIESNTK